MGGVTIEDARADTQKVYERNAANWDSHRSQSLFERSWLDRFSVRVKPGGQLLDLGCGTGDPIARHFLKAGFQVTGVDYAGPMIEIARQRFPAAQWHVGDIRSLKLNRFFHGVYSWDGSFHLSANEQRNFLKSMTSLVHPGGAIMLTVGPAEGEVFGTVEGEQVYHASLSPEEYRCRLEDAGFGDIEFTAEDPECAGHSVILATRLG